ncbi:MAG: FtsX-like permease family protein [Clostridia bacterium]|nr:FtsX-like permease family protein [Clostridia bacterium]
MDLIRSIRKSIMRFISIVAIVALGISFFVGIKSASPDMRNTANEYFVSDNVLDLSVISTIGFTDDEVDKIAQVEGVRAVDPIKLADTLVFVDGKGIVNVENGAAMACRVMSMDFSRAYAFSQSGEGDDSYINRITLVEGRYPKNKNECLIDNAVAGSYSELEIGNTITLAGDGVTLSDTLNTDTFTIVGTVSTPMYISFERGSTNIGSGTLGMYLYIGEDCFVSDYYGQVYATVDNKEQYDAFSQEYNDYVSKIGKRIEAIADESISDRLAQVKEEYKQKIAEGEETYKKMEAETNAQLEDALAKINVIEEYIESGDSKIASAQTQLSNKIASAEGELKASKEKYESSLADYEANKALANDADNEIDGYKKAKEIYNNYLERQKTDRAEIDALAAALPALKSEADKAKAELDSAEKVCSNLQNQINQKEKDLAENKKILEVFKEEEANWSPETSFEPIETIQGYVAEFTKKCNDLQAEINSLKAQLTQAETTKSNAKAKYDAKAAEYTAQQATIKSREETYQSNQDVLNSYADDIEKLEQGEKDLDIFKNALNDAAKELEAAKIKITESQLKLYYEESKGNKEITAGQADLKAAKVRLESAEEAYSDAEHEVRVGLKKAQGDIDKAKTALEELNNSTWTVSYQSDLPGHESYGQSLENVTAMANVFPVFFFLIAAMMCLATMTRMVEEERMQLGTLKALGYNENSILSKYYWYAAVACVAGSVVGVVIGAVVFPKAINSAYAMMYCLPDVKIYFHWQYILIGTLFSLVSTLSATLIACRRALKTQAAELMRPKSPKPGKRVFLERFTGLWNSMSFGSIVTVRNMFRSKRRMVMTILGVAGCTMLILAAFGINNSVDTIISAQYGEDGISHYNLMAVLDDEQLPGQSETVKDLEKDIRVNNAMLLDTRTMTASSSKEDNDTEMSIHLYVPESNEKLKECITLRSRKGNETYDLTDDGAVITEKLAEDTETKVGDMLVLTAVDGKEYQVKVAAIVENYVYHYVYISPSYYQNVFGENPEFMYVLATLKDYTNANDEQNMADDLLAYNEVAGVVSTDVMIDSFNAIVDRLDVVVVIFIIAAGLLAFVILYNLTNISVQERLREIATIKVVGFTDAEVTAYVYRENIFLTIAGILVGLLGGVGLHRIVIDIAEVNVVMFGRDIYWWSFLLAVLLTAVFAALVSLLVHKRLQRFDVIAALKSVE